MNPIARFVSGLEKRICSIPLLANLYLLPYRKVVQRECQLAEIDAGDRVLNIGCGAIPFTAILIHRLTGASVLALDRDPQSLEKAKVCLEGLGLRDEIRLLEADGSQRIDLSYNVAVVALQAEPKLEILKQLLQRAEDDYRFVFRQPREEFKKLYDFIPGEIRPLAAVKQEMQTFDRSLLFNTKTCLPQERREDEII